MGSIHVVYDELNDEELALVNDTARQVAQCYMSAGYKVPGDDRAEVMVEALAVFLRTCTKE